MRSYSKLVTSLVLFSTLSSVAAPMAMASCHHAEKKGAIIGAILGAVIGGNHPVRGAILGGAAGVLVGSEIGCDVDQDDQYQFGNTYNECLEHDQEGYAEDWQGPHGHGRITIVHSGYVAAERTECRQWSSVYFDPYGGRHEEGGYVCREQMEWQPRTEVVFESDSGASFDADRRDRYHDRYVDFRYIDSLERRLNYTRFDGEQMNLIMSFADEVRSRGETIRFSDREDILRQCNPRVRRDARNVLDRISAF